VQQLDVSQQQLADMSATAWPLVRDAISSPPLIDAMLPTSRLARSNASRFAFGRPLVASATSPFLDSIGISLPTKATHENAPLRKKTTSG
jgi:hypothetical protein